MIQQILKVIRLLGLRRAARMKKHHDVGLGYVRGYAVCQCWWAMLRCGLGDELLDHGTVDLDDFLRCRNLQPPILAAMIDYLHGAGLLELDGRAASLSPTGRILMQEPRGFFELALAYDPCFRNLSPALAGEKCYGRDFTRDVTLVGIGSGRLCEQLPYRVMRKMILDRHCRMVLDLGCGDLALLAGLCRLDSDIRGHGIDLSADMIRYNQRQLEHDNFAGRLTAAQADMFVLPPLPDSLPPVDCITACDTFHEYLGSGQDQERLVNLLHTLKIRFPAATFIIGEFCLQDPAWLRKHKTASLEHHLFHQLSNQQIGSAQLWHDLFHAAGLQIIEENIFDLIGHGYFALK
jgi:hypothetical protein